jgi:hypothetical protein
LVVMHSSAAPPLPALPPVPMTEAPPPPAMFKYHFTDHENRPSALPVTRAELDHLFTAGAITPRTWVLLEGSGEWIPYGVLRAASRPAPAPISSQN